MPDPIPIPSASTTNAFSQLNNLLKAAEDEANKCDTLRISASRLQLQLVAFNALLAALSVLTWLPSSNVSETSKFFYTAIMGFASLYLLAQWLPEFRQQKSNLSRHQRVLAGFVDLIRAIEPHHTQEGQLSHLERAILRLLLAQFDIGPEADARPEPLSLRAAPPIAPATPPLKRPEELTSTP